MGPFQQPPLGAQTLGGTKIIEIRVGSETYLGGGIFNIISHGEYQPLVEKNAYLCSICCFLPTITMECVQMVTVKCGKHSILFVIPSHTQPDIGDTTTPCFYGLV